MMGLGKISKDLAKVIKESLASTKDLQKHADAILSKVEEAESGGKGGKDEAKMQEAMKKLQEQMKSIADQQSTAAKAMQEIVKNMK